jgi:hypothetical protein
VKYGSSDYSENLLLRRNKPVKVVKMITRVEAELVLNPSS